MKFTVVVPSYNQAEYLRATLDSILSESVGPTEVLVFDGGSTDASVDILRTYEDRISWVSRKDRGQTDAINQGLHQATGDVLAYLNSDDVYLPGALEHVARHFRDHPESQILYGRAHHLKADGSYLEDYPTEPWNWQRLQETCFICQPAVFWRRGVLERHGVFDPELHYAMDYEYWFRVGRTHPFAYLGDQPPLAGSRLHDQTKTLGARVKVHREILQVVQRYADSPAPVQRWLGHLAHHRTESEMPERTNGAERRAFALRWASYVLLYAAEFEVPVDAQLLASIEPHLVGNGL